jgi:hypothetical protein
VGEEERNSLKIRSRAIASQDELDIYGFITHYKTDRNIVNFVPTTKKIKISCTSEDVSR